MADTKYAVEVHNVKKQFSYARHKNNSLKRAITQVFKKKDKGRDAFYALNGVSFNVEKGDFFGILGRNGSGKSTLLKIISEIYQPTNGSVRHEGKLVSFIELGVGFQPELTGHDNVYLNGALLGFSKEEIDEMYDDIVSFSELEKFMDQTLKNYSSGMKVRLAFSVAIRAKADILILDEVLAVGDAAFQKKCNEYFQTLKEDNRTVILVTHSMSAVKNYCNKAILIEGGRIVHSGDADEVADEYTRLFIESKDADGSTRDKNRFGEGGASITEIKTKIRDDVIDLHIGIKSDTVASANIALGVDVVDSNRKLVAGFESSTITGNSLYTVEPNQSYNFHYQLENIFGSGDYNVNVSLKESDNSRIYDFWRRATAFTNINKKDYDSYFPVVLPAVRITDASKKKTRDTE